MNKVMLIGRVGKQPELSSLPDGKPTVKFTLATSETYKDRNGEKVEKTEWHNIVGYGSLATICSTYVSKGSQLFIEGKVQRDEWEKDGVKHNMTKIIMKEMKMLGNKKSEPQEPEQMPIDQVPF